MNNKKIGSVLFVDDEKKILRSLKRSFFRESFKTFFASGGNDAIEIIRKNEIDIIVTDVRMPDMTGLELLKIIKNRYPFIHRVILSGFVEEQSVINALNSGLATTYFAKPWDDKVLKEKILHLFKIRKYLKGTNLLKLLGLIDNFPTLPSLYHEFTEALEKDKNIGYIVKIIQRDVAAASKILKVANSAFYGGKRVQNLKKAAVKIGLQAVKNIFLTLSVVNSMQWDDYQIKKLEAIFSHSSLVNKFVKHIYEKKYNKMLPANYSAAGIVHDIGKIIILQYFTDTYRKIEKELNNNTTKSFYDIELELGREGKTHCEIGAYFMNNWNFPQVLVEVSLFHHSPEFASKHNKDLIKLVNLADRLIDTVQRNDIEAEVDYDNFEDFGFTKIELRNLIKKVKKEINETKL